MPEDGTLRVAAIGVGSLGRHHARNYAEMAAEGRIRLIGACDTNAETAEAIAAEYGCEGLTDWRDLIGRVDAFPSRPDRPSLRDSMLLFGAGVHGSSKKQSQ